MLFVAIYSDNTRCAWDEDTPNENAYGKIDRSKLIGFELHDPRRAKEKPPRKTLIHRLHLEKGERLIVRRRVKQQILSEKTESVYLIGYVETIAGQTRQAISVIFEDGHTELISVWKEVPFHSPILKEEERGH